ncbi:hypothetical protein SAMN04488695_1286 [Proteiniclasticum ruminis]|uniref:Uncharacterized protein n=1 Tax=Proteiniclasticum ruminis TaxID=398199 RepID=A0A1I5F3L9_9CLOT|nr:hypothetical protein SAMN04488695_1286 [Proteiniclasticum ruminis]
MIENLEIEEFTTITKAFVIDIIFEFYLCIIVTNS